MSDWTEPDGMPIEEGEHPHYAIWDHVGRKWDVLSDNPLTQSIMLTEALARAERLEAAIAAHLGVCQSIWNDRQPLLLALAASE